MGSALASGANGEGNAMPETSTPRTLFEKIWARHRVLERPDGQTLLYVDRHLVHDGSAPAFQSAARRGIKVRAPERTFATPDHYVLTDSRGVDEIADPERRGMVEQLAANTAARGHQAVRAGRSAAGHRACRRAGGGAEPARHAAGVRRQPYLDPWRVRRAGVRHRRRRRWRMCWRRRRCGSASRRRCASRSTATLGDGGDGEGRDPGHHRRDRRGRGDRACHRICRQRDHAACRWRGG